MERIIIWFRKNWGRIRILMFIIFVILSLHSIITMRNSLENYSINITTSTELKSGTSMNQNAAPTGISLKNSDHNMVFDNKINQSVAQLTNQTITVNTTYTLDKSTVNKITYQLAYTMFSLSGSFGLFLSLFLGKKEKQKAEESELPMLM